MLERIGKNLKWLLWGLVAFVTTTLAIIFKGMEVPEERRKPKVPDLPPKLKQRVRKAEEAAVVARVTAKVKHDHQKEELEEIKQISDDDERRKRLAALMGEMW